MTDMRLLSVRTGRVAVWQGTTVRTGMNKQPVVGAVKLGLLGLEGDEQADTLHHGGVDKAVHHYPGDHYSEWSVELPLADGAWSVGRFGENFSTLGMSERQVCIGDIYRVGTALLQVSSGRRPCHKLALTMGVDDMVQRVAATRRTGWYYRVIEPGEVSCEDTLRLVSRVHAEWPVFRVVGAILCEDATASEYEQLACMRELYAGWRTVAQTRLSQR